jgi:hypothetical protein
MFCPRCAAENGDDSRYCRACGLDLTSAAAIARNEPVAAAVIRDEPPRLPESEESLQRRAAAARRITSGAILLLIPMLTGPIFGMVVETPFLALILWVAFFGWMLIPAGFSLSQGLGDFMEQRVLRRARRDDEGPSGALQAARFAALQSADAPPSVVEHTTRKLDTNGLGDP